MEVDVLPWVQQKLSGQPYSKISLYGLRWVFYRAQKSFMSYANIQEQANGRRCLLVIAVKKTETCDVHQR